MAVRSAAAPLAAEPEVEVRTAAPSPAAAPDVAAKSVEVPSAEVEPVAAVPDVASVVPLLVDTSRTASPVAVPFGPESTPPAPAPTLEPSCAPLVEVAFGEAALVEAALVEANCVAFEEVEEEVELADPSATAELPCWAVVESLAAGGA